jgi:hypothetical protein
MTTEYFNVRNGFSVGEDTFTVEASTGDVVVGGNLTVNGTTTTFNTTQLEIEDNIIVLNKNVTGAPTLNAGIAIERGQGTDAALTWNENTDKWEQNRGGTSTVIPVNTTELVEGTNLYHTAQRAVDAVEAAGYATETQVDLKLNTTDFTSTANTWLGTRSTTNVTEGTNLYYTAARAKAEINNSNPGSFIGLTASGNIDLLDSISVGDATKTGYQGIEFNSNNKTASLVVDHTTGKLIYSKDAVTYTPIAQSTTELAEGTNLYYTDARVGNYLSVNSWATQEYVGVQVANLIASAPSTLNTLNELATALGNDANFATTVTTALGTKLATADFTTTANTWLGTKSTTGLAEGTNLYYTDTRARASNSAGTGVTYNSSTGAISIGQAVASTDSPTFVTVTATGNMIKGAVRNSTTAAAGDTWALNAATSLQPFRGVSVDNSADTAKNAGLILRNYSASLGNRSRIVFERARGTLAAPTPVLSGDFIGSIEATGCNANNVFINDAVQTGASATTIPAFINFTAAENWDTGTGSGPRFGTQFGLTLAPTATAIQSSTNLVPVITANPQSFASRSDAFTWANGKTGSTQTMALDVSGHLTVTGDVRINGNNIQGSGGLAAIDLTSGNTLTTFRTNTGLFQTAANVQYASLNATGSTFVCSGITNFIRSGTDIGIKPAFRAQYKNTTNTDSNAGDGSQVLLSTAGSVTENNIARFDATFGASGNHQFGIAVSHDNFETTNSTLKATRDKTEILTTPSGGGTSTTRLTVEATKITAAAPVAYPSYTTTQRDALTPAAGWVLFNSTTGKLECHNGTTWNALF